MSFLKRLCQCLLLLPALFVLAQQPSVAAPKKWDIQSIAGVDYVKLSDVWKFYKFAPKKGRSGCVSYGAGNRVVSVRPSHQDFYVNNYRYILSYPVRDINGTLMISTLDMKKLVDPVLRPRYSPTSGPVTTVVIDAGHGGHDAGAVSAYAREKDCNLAVAMKLKAKLEKQGFRVVMTRDGDYFLTLKQRVDIANATPNSIFVSIHHNSGRRAAEGIETFTLAPQGTTSPFARTRRYAELCGNDQDCENIALATAVHSRAIHSTKAVDRGIQRARFSVLCTIQRPAILFEGGFVSNAAEGRKISSNTYREKLADSICQGVVSYSQTVGGRRPMQKTNGARMAGSSSKGGFIVGGNTYRGTTRL